MTPGRDTDEDAWVGARLWRWNKQRRARKKARIRAMTRPKRILRKVGVIGTWMLAFLAVVVVTAVTLFYTLSDVIPPDEVPLPQVATIEFADGSTMARIGDVNRTIVPLSKVPEGVRWAVLAAEDRKFYSEPGVSITGT